MPHIQGFFQHLWHSFKDQIVQPVPQEILFCEFDCPFQHCRREATGHCELLPYAAPVLIQPAQAVVRPQWATIPAASASGTPIRVN
jgi:hypothetical protein